MINAVKFATSVLALATACLAQEGLTIDTYSVVEEKVRYQLSNSSSGQTCSGRQQERCVVG
jgi:hypothetical protein